MQVLKRNIVPVTAGAVLVALAGTTFAFAGPTASPSSSSTASATAQTGPAAKDPDLQPAMDELWSQLMAAQSYGDDGETCAPDKLVKAGVLAATKALPLCSSLDSGSTARSSASPTATSSPTATEPDEQPTVVPTMRGTAPTDTGGSNTSGVSTPMLDGAAGAGVASGTFAKAFGVGATSNAATWINDDCKNTSSLTQEYGSWNKPLIVAVGAINASKAPESNMSWADAAGGKAEPYWQACLDNIKAAWGDRDLGLLTISFAHEANQGGSQWFGWKVHHGEEGDFKKAEHRFAQMVRKTLPGSQITVVLTGAPIDNAEAFLPTDKADLDVLGVDFYALHYKDGQRLDPFYKLASDRGVSLLIQEYGFKNKPDEDGDPVAYMSYMQAQFDTHSGTGAGQISRAVLFNVADGQGYAVTNGDGTGPNTSNNQDGIREVGRLLKANQVN